ncbi:hypothetical protein Tmar_0474 [Thermaerobacter marianensis DSM 12885]|uniref:DUF4340 domain-containing protein n=1 Tax=Thermaerobacter marianensis (strain ATCC 700841 / DSM 12885 / JCM 10246 / 7p75a) TaxID=644966 RepID=E6SGP9_THEM7|nr:DUF4340 domain-containing protein [Thermaerobacter marianensis]ADU50595.1 hypothetical protein Tmar_0474 [Thermaerobacter marianensis DSM 12885]
MSAGRRRGRNPVRQAFLGLFLLVVAAGLAVYAWATRGQQPAGEGDAAGGSTVVWDAGDATVREVLVEGKHGRILLRPGPPPELVVSPDAPFGGQGPMAADTIEGLLSSRRWWIHDPGPYPVAEEYATTIADGLRKLTAQRLVAEGVAERDLAQYGLDRPATRVTVRFTGQDGAKVLELGAQSPLTGGGTYARVAGEDKVYLLAPGLADTLTMAPDQLRETMFVPFNADRVQRVELQWGDDRLVFVRQEGGTNWSMEHNGRRVGTQDGSQLSELWFALHQWRAAAFVTDQGDDPAVRKRHGLDEPYGRIRLEFQPAPGQKSGPYLEIRAGATAAEGGRYVATSEGPWVYRLDPDDLSYFEDQVLPGLKKPATDAKPNGGQGSDQGSGQNAQPSRSQGGEGGEGGSGGGQGGGS